MSIVKFDADKILRDKTVVYCRTEEQAKNLFEWADSIGMTWASGSSYDYLKTYYKDIAYYIYEGRHSKLEYYESDGYTILSYEDALLTFPRKMLVWDNNEWEAVEATVHAIVDTLTYYPVITEGSRYKHAKELPAEQHNDEMSCGHNNEFVHSYDGVQISDLSISKLREVYTFVSDKKNKHIISDEYRNVVVEEFQKRLVEQYRDMTHAEVFKAIREGAVLRCKNNKPFVFNSWDNSNAVNIHEICHDFTDTDADVWEEMKVRV